MSIYDSFSKTMRRSKGKYAKIQNDPTSHHPNKNERAKLREIKKRTGLSEEEIRADKNLRRELSEAQKEGSRLKPEGQLFRKLRGIVKNACRESRLSLEHPDLLGFIEAEIDRRRSAIWLPRSYTEDCFQSASAALQKYNELLSERKKR